MNTCLSKCLLSCPTRNRHRILLIRRPTGRIFWIFSQRYDFGKKKYKHQIFQQCNSLKIKFRSRPRCLLELRALFLQEDIPRSISLRGSFIIRFFAHKTLYTYRWTAGRSACCTERHLSSVPTHETTLIWFSGSWAKLISHSIKLKTICSTCCTKQKLCILSIECIYVPHINPVYCPYIVLMYFI
jgi:hypothetical protein